MQSAARTHSFITPTTCFTLACVAFSALAVSTIWRNHCQTAPEAQPEQTKKPAHLRPRPVRRRGVDSIYGDPEARARGHAHSEVALPTRPPGPSGILSNLIGLCASLSQRLRSSHEDLRSRPQTTALIGKLSLATTSLCHLQQQTRAGLMLEGDAGLEACYETTISGLRECLLALQTALGKGEECKHDAVNSALQQLVEQLPLLDFLVEQDTVPPTPPCEADIEADMKAADVVAPHAMQTVHTGITPSVDVKGWMEPPPEYSPRSSSPPTIASSDEKDKEAFSANLKNGSKDPESEHTPLYSALLGNDLPLIATLLALGVSPTEPSGPFARTPLHHAAEENLPKALEHLLAHTTYPSPHDAAGDTPLHLAAWAGHLPTLTLLLNHAQTDPNTPNPTDAYTPLLAAVTAAHTPSVSLLLTHHASPSPRTFDTGMTPLHQAASMGSTEIAALLLAAPGTAVDATDASGNTALHFACAAGELALTQLLIETGGARPSARQSMGLTPLHWAAHKGHANVAEYLLEVCGVDVEAQGEGGVRALHCAAARGWVGVVGVLLGFGAEKGARAVWDGGEGTAGGLAEGRGWVRVGRVLGG